MLRITEKLEQSAILRLRLDGTINSETYSELASVLARHNGASTKTIILDMAGVDFMNHEVARKLLGLRGERLRIINCSPFIIMLLETVDRQDAKLKE